MQDLARDQANSHPSTKDEFGTIAAVIVDTAIRQSALSKALWKEVSDSHIDAELASDSEEGPRGIARRHLAVLSRFERSSAQVHRLAEAQIRSLTELFLVRSNGMKPQAANGTHSTAGRRESIDSVRATSSPIRRSATLPSGSRQTSPRMDRAGTPASLRRPRHVNTLQRIDSITDDGPSQQGHAREQSSRTEPNVPSPRALQRAKSTVSFDRIGVSHSLSDAHAYSQPRWSHKA